MDNVTVLVADADKGTLNLIGITLKTHDYKCVTSENGESALILASSNRPDIILLDLVLPDMDGIELIRKMRSWSNAPIVVISSRKEDHDKIMALDAGADDYLTKPFSIEELLARLRVIKRRHLNKDSQTENLTVFENGDLKIDYSSNCVYIKNKEVHLTPIEYRLLCVLSKNVGKVLTHSYITKEIWGNTWDSTIMTLRTFITSLRKKLNKDNSKEFIHTHTSVGYRMILY